MFSKVRCWALRFRCLTFAQRLADLITAASDGRLAVKHYAAGGFVSAFESFDAVREGKAHMFRAASSYWTKKFLT